jgi:hypothetical protein
MIRIENVTPRSNEEPHIRTDDVRKSLLDHGVLNLNCPSCGKEGIRNGAPGLEIKQGYEEPFPRFIMICQACGFIRALANAELHTRAGYKNAVTQHRAKTAQKKPYNECELDSPLYRNHRFRMSSS